MLPIIYTIMTNIQKITIIMINIIVMIIFLIVIMTIVQKIGYDCLSPL